MSENELTIFENKKIRKVEHNGEWNFSVVDIIEILTESERPNKYWSDLKSKLKEEGNELSGKIGRLKMQSKDGKSYLTDCANRETIFRIIQSIPSPKVEPFKLWLAKLAEERIQEINDPSLAIERARQTYIKKGYTPEWTIARIRSTGSRTELTDEWKNRGAENRDYAILTDEISKGTFSISIKEYKDIKGLKKSNSNLRDNMSAIELALLTLAEATTTEIHKTNDSYGLTQLKKDARDGGEIASVTRKNIELKLGKSIITSENALDFTNKKQLNTSN